MNMPWLIRLALAATAIVTANQALAQGVASRGFIGLGIGPSAPFGGFADSSSGNARAGRATPGYTDTFLNFGYRYGERFGVAVAISYGEFSMHGDGDDDWWQVAAITAGPMYTLPLTARMALDLKAMLGLIVLTPVIDGVTTDLGVGPGLGMDVRATVRYDVYRRWALFGEVGLQSAGVSYGAGAGTAYRAIISGLGVAYRPSW